MNTNLFKTVLMSLIIGVGVAVGFCLGELVTNALEFTDLTNDQLSHHASIAFLIGAAVCFIYSFVTKRQW